MASARWYPDPTQEGRLRYWDGSAWTEHVSQNGEVAQDPITSIAPAPPRDEAAPAPSPAHATVEPPSHAAADAPLAAQAPPAAAGAMGGIGAALANKGPYPAGMVGRLGLVIAAVGGLLSIFAQGRVAVRQETPLGSDLTISVGGGIWIGVLAAVLCLAAAAAPWAWARLAGVTVAWLGGVVLCLALIGLRSSDNLLASVDQISLGPAGWLMFFGALLLFVGMAISLARLRIPVAGPDGGPLRDGKAVSALITGIVAFIIPVSGATAVGLAQYAFDDDRASGGRVGGRGMAVAGLVLGIVAMGLWGVGLLLGALLATP